MFLRDRRTVEREVVTAVMRLISPSVLTVKQEIAAVVDERYSS